MKKAVLFAITITMIVAAFCFMTSYAEEPVLPETNWNDYAQKPTIAADGVTYEIRTAEELAWISKTVAYQSSSFGGKTILLMNDINLSARLWTPIGTESYPFKGVLKGNNKTIIGLTVSGKYSYAGLIGYSNRETSDVIMKNA